MKKILSIFFIITTFFISGCSEKNSPENQVLSYNLPSEPKSLDPQISDDFSSNTVLINMFEGLTRLNQEGAVVPGVAKSWESLDNNTKFIFHLRNDTFWGNKEKTPVTAKDFVFGFKRAVDKKTNAPCVSTLFCIKNAKKINDLNMDISDLGIKALDEYTLEIDLEYPIVDFPKVTTNMITMPCNEEFFNASEGQYGLELKTVLGNGPFKLKNKYGWDHYKSMSLIKNDGYKGDTLPISAGINFDIGKDISNPLDSIKNGLLDASPIKYENLTEAKNEKLKITSFEDTISTIAFNLSDSTYSNLNIRKCIISGLDREYALSEISNGRSITNKLTLDDLQVNGSKFSNIYGDYLYLKNSKNCKTFLDLGLKELSLKELPKTSITCLDDPKVKAIVSNIIEKLNKNINFNFNMTPVSQNELISKAKNKDYQIILYPIILESDSAIEFFNYFTSENKNNFVGLKDTNYDNFISMAFNSYDNANTIKIVSDADKYLNENIIIYPLYTEKHYFTSAKNVSGIIFNKYKKGIDFLYSKKIK